MNNIKKGTKVGSKTKCALPVKKESSLQSSTWMWFGKTIIANNYELSQI